VHRSAILTTEITDLKQLVTMMLSTPNVVVSITLTTFVMSASSLLLLLTAYKHYFACQVGDQDEKWAPHICCNRCRTSLLFWLDGKRKQMPFAVPMVWREQSDHVTDCYFCMTNIRGFSRKNNSKIF